MPEYVCAEIYAFQHEKPKLPHDSPYPWTQPDDGKNNQMLSEKAPSEGLDKNNQKRLQKFLEILLYYAKAIDPKMLMALNSLEAVQKKTTIENAKQITRFLNYGTAHSNAIIEYIKSGIILHIYSDASYISEPKAQSRVGGYFS